MTSPQAIATPQLEVRNLCKSYDEGRIEALCGVDLTIAAGEYLAITGASGSGKSTLLQLLGGLDTPTSGEVLFENAALGTAHRPRRLQSPSSGIHLSGFLSAAHALRS